MPALQCKNMQGRGMPFGSVSRVAGLCAALALLAWSAQLARARVTPAPARPLRVLIVGNSYTRFNLLPHLLARLSAAVPGGPRLLVDAEARSGFSLRMHLRAGQVLPRIRNGHYDAVVLQAHSLSAVDHPAELVQDAERFKRAIDAAGARTVLYETWPRHPSARLYRRHPLVHSFEQMAGRVDATYADLALHLGAQLAPIGSAFERALATEPALVLWGPDGSHPTLAGSFLAACVLYGAIASEDPRASSYVPPTMCQDRAELIEALAEATLAGADVAPCAAPAAPDVPVAATP